VESVSQLFLAFLLYVEFNPEPVGPLGGAEDIICAFKELEEIVTQYNQ
jgi:hypothetical protein